MLNIRPTFSSRVALCSTSNSKLLVMATSSKTVGSQIAIIERGLPSIKTLRTGLIPRFRGTYSSSIHLEILQNNLKNVSNSTENLPIYFDIYLFNLEL